MVSSAPNEGPTRPNGPGGPSTSRPNGPGGPSTSRPNGPGGPSTSRPNGPDGSSTSRPNGPGGPSTSRPNGPGGPSTSRPNGPDGPSTSRPNGPGGPSTSRPNGPGGPSTSRPNGPGGPSTSRPNGPGNFGSGDDGFKGLLAAKVCADQTLAQELLKQMKELFDTLESDESFTQVLGDRAKEIAYIRSSSNAKLLSSDCTAYFNGLKSAVDADRVVVEARLQYYHIAAEAMMKIVQKLFGVPRP